ncbi:MAG: 50S ribosome-binding GTPase, partial [Chloroflexus sp.]|nr:50S ribosome-binding GTPase [Chloroflexus sp.]
MTKPIVAIVGRPNVGKSTFFNRLIGERRAIVEDIPGTTRDRLYGDTFWNGREFTVVDTAGILFGGEDPTLPEAEISRRTRAQAEHAIAEADAIIFMVDGRDGLTSADAEVAAILRTTSKPVVLAVNKCDSQERMLDAVEFYALNLGDPIPMSAFHGLGTGDVLDR